MSGNFTGSGNALSYAWNNQLGRYIKAGSPAVTHRWYFDALGRRIQWSGDRTHRYYYDGEQIVEHVEWNGSTESPRKLCVWGERIDDLLLYQFHVPNPDEVSYAHEDHLGSVAVLADETGAIREGYRYWEWGQTTIVDASFVKLTTNEGPSRNNVRYAGRDQYTVLGDVNDTWYHNRARAYRTGWGRFTGRDRITSAHLYLYVNASPIVYADPLGLEGDKVIGQPDSGPCVTAKGTCKKTGENLYQACVDVKFQDMDGHFNPPDHVCDGTVCVECHEDDAGKLYDITVCCNLNCDGSQGIAGSLSGPSGSQVTNDPPPDDSQAHTGESDCIEVGYGWKDQSGNAQGTNLSYNDYVGNIKTSAAAGFVTGGTGGLIGGGPPGAVAGGIGGALVGATGAVFSDPPGAESWCCPSR
jgi:RHS repeat-associated protein